MKTFCFRKKTGKRLDFRLDETELAQLFGQWLARQGKKWLDYYYSDYIIREFMTGDDGLQSSFDEDDYGDIYDCLWSIYIDFVYHKKEETAWKS